MRLFRNVIFWAHLVTGLFVGVVVLIMSVTGVLLTYQRQITVWADTRGLNAGPPSPGAERLGPEALLARVREVEPGEPTSIKWHADPDRPVEVAYGRGRTLFVHGYTGEVLGTGNDAVRSFFRVVVAWHRWLGAEGDNRALGRAITGACNLGFLFLVLSGFYLWWPRNWTRKAFMNVLFFRRGLSGKARDFNWHNVIGLWSAVPLAVVVASAVVISYPWASDLVYRLAGDTPPGATARGAGGGPGGGAGADRGGPRAGGAPARGGEPRGRVEPREAAAAGLAGASEGTASAAMDGVDALVARAESRLPGWRSITLQIPGSASDPVTFAIDRGDGGQPQKRAQFVLDRVTGDEVKWETFADNSPGRRARSILRFAHTGEVAGLLGQTIAGLVSAGAVLLVWTGVALAWRRFRAWRGRSGRRLERESGPREGELVRVG
jgi:uncharacterized iron-regulated membrane protein